MWKTITAHLILLVLDSKTDQRFNSQANTFGILFSPTEYPHSPI